MAIRSSTPNVCKLKAENTALGSVTYTVQKTRISIRLIAPYSDARRKAAGEYVKGMGLGKGKRGKTGAVGADCVTNKEKLY